MKVKRKAQISKLKAEPRTLNLPTLNRGTSIRRFADFAGVSFLVRRMEIKINAAKRALAIGLAEDDRDLAIERNAMAEMRAAVLIGFDRFVHQTAQGPFAVFRNLLDAHDKFVVSLDCLGDLVLESVGSHVSTIRAF